jgi:hypothetical protein
MCLIATRLSEPLTYCDGELASWLRYRRAVRGWLVLFGELATPHYKLTEVEEGSVGNVKVTVFRLECRRN